MRPRHHARNQLTRTILVVTALATVMAGTGMAAPADVPVTIVSVDPYTNTSSHHRTEVEPDSYSYGSTIVGTFQVGRFTDGGASNVGWTTSTNSGGSWTYGFLPGTTPYSTPQGEWARVSDPSVAYDAAHGVWMIATLGITSGLTGKAILVSRSTNGGLTWGNPVTAAEGGGFSFYDKQWITCDDWPQSPFYGNCYIQWDDAYSGNELLMARSTNGGLTWTMSSVPNQDVIGGVPVTLPDGTVVVPIDAAFSSQLESYVSTNGGLSYQGPFTIANITEHFVDGNMRTFALPSAEVDGSGRVYVAWQDCRFRSACHSNDIVISSSVNGTSWTSPVRVPIDPVSTNVDHFLPGIAADRTTGGAGANLGLSFYYYTNADCSPSTCNLNIGYISSPDGGASWGAPIKITGGMRNTWFPLTTSGYMVGDYISTSFGSNGRAYPMIIGARSGVCDVGQITSCKVTAISATNGLPVAATGLTPAGLDRPVPNARSDRPSARPTMAN